jgi:hypothetical protein
VKIIREHYIIFTVLIVVVLALVLFNYDDIIPNKVDINCTEISNLSIDDEWVSDIKSEPQDFGLADGKIANEIADNRSDYRILKCNLDVKSNLLFHKYDLLYFSQLFDKKFKNLVVGHEELRWTNYSFGRPLRSIDPVIFIIVKLSGKSDQEVMGLFRKQKFSCKVELVYANGGDDGMSDGYRAFDAGILDLSKSSVNGDLPN